MKANVKKLSTGLLVFVSVLLILSSCSEGADDTASASYRPEDGGSSTIAAEGMRASRGRLIPEVRAAGIAEGVKEAWVISETEGIIESVGFTLGARVRQGDILLTVNPDLALRNLKLAEQKYKTALLEYEASKLSRANGSISELQFSQITDRLLAAEASEASARDAFGNTSLKAPFSGAIAARDSNLGVGNYLSRGVPVARIVDDREFRTEVSVGEGQVLLVKEGSAATVRGNDGIVREGRVKAVSAGSDAGTGSFTVVVEWIPEEGDALRSGMSVDVSIVPSDNGGRIIIPASVIRIREGQDYVFIDNDGVAELRPIDTGSRLGDRVEVLSGIDEGETLITSGLASLSSGSAVNVTLVGNSGEF